MKKLLKSQEDNNLKTGLNKKWNGRFGVCPINTEQIQGYNYEIKDGPPRQLPLELLDDFTLNNKVDIRFWYCNGETTGVEKIKNIFKKNEIDNFIELAKNKKLGYYGEVAMQIHVAFDEYLVKNQTIAVMGSTSPICESFCLAYGAKPVTIEYKEIDCDDERIETYTVKEFYKNPKLCDFAISISSFEHDGLGQYGDPIDPYGDIKAMERMKHTVKKNGIFFLAVPIGKDRIDWNAHRVYGSVRLPMLLENWKTVATVGFDESMYTILPQDPREENFNYGYKHALFVLKNI